MSSSPSRPSARSIPQSKRESAKRLGATFYGKKPVIIRKVKQSPQRTRAIEEFFDIELS